MLSIVSLSVIMILSTLVQAYANIPISEFDSNAKIAKERAIMQGKQIALQSLIKKEYDINYDPKTIDVKTLDYLIQNYNLRNERIYQNGYSAIIEVNFYHNRVAHLLKNDVLNKDGYATLLIPLYTNEQGKAYFNDSNFNLESNNEILKKHNLIVLSGDLEDIKLINKGLGTSSNHNDYRLLLDKYKAQNILVFNLSDSGDLRHLILKYITQSKINEKNDIISLQNNTPDLVLNIIDLHMESMKTNYTKENHLQVRIINPNLTAWHKVKKLIYSDNLMNKYEVKSISLHQVILQSKDKIGKDQLYNDLHNNGFQIIKITDKTVTVK